MKTGVLIVLILFSLSLVSASIQVTKEHPFLVNNSWVSASQLQVGQILDNILGQRVRITDIKKVVQDTSVFNIETSVNNYIVDNLIVHNSQELVTCFTGDSLVSLEDGTTKPIQDLKEGDRILSWNFEKNNLVGAVVNKIFKTLHSEIYVINNKINVTAEHPFWTKEKGWAAINPQLTQQNHGWMPSILEVGDHLMKSNRQYIKINSIIKKDEFKEVYTYNLDVPAYNNYFIEDILVHNKAPRLLTAAEKLSLERFTTEFVGKKASIPYGEHSLYRVSGKKAISDAGFLDWINRHSPGGPEAIQGLNRVQVENLAMDVVTKALANPNANRISITFVEGGIRKTWYWDYPQTTECFNSWNGKLLGGLSFHGTKVTF